ncbi:hypothetical protein RY831_05105 [Noviherbaspirillum sp. CPCC 100848]|uniref:Uncharacterized protein n=1 Tax=Noviherbaspirillum album TaxID=3080276 RepID=A0ABU6J5M3_9BURK|nr:hypothetical protein [Noviherbaspirillum sp. CPCC 100848]MEC4718514.1 hypothetical protein [Noviherbaspirillum sp. CPCC 100848]
MGIPPVAASGADAYRKVNNDDENGGCGKSAAPPDSKGGVNDPFDEEIKKLPDGPLRNELIFLRNSAGGV